MVAKVVALSGAQGSGKSTLLKALRVEGWHVDDFRVSRAVQEQLGWKSLDTVMTSWDTMVEFQDEVLHQKRLRDSQLHEGFIGDQEIILTERSFADILAYTTYWTWELVDQGKQTFEVAAGWLKNYETKCVWAQLGCYDGIILLPFMSNIPWEDDPHRARKETVENVFESVFNFSHRYEFIEMPKLLVKEQAVDARVNEVAKFLRGMT